MNELHWESWAVILALGISLGYIILPAPYWMGAFTFIAQPLLGLAILSYGIKVIKDLRKGGAL